MGNGSVVGAVIMALCCFGCALTFMAIAAWARKSTKPVTFWSGTSVPADKVTDVSAYNHANAVMWSVYSVPFWLAGLVGAFGFLGDVYTMVSTILLSVSCFPGMFLLIWAYRRIEKRYVSQ